MKMRSKLGSSTSIEVEVKMQPVHPGRILQRELTVRNLSANQLALALRVPSGRITSLGGKRSVTADTALRLARYFGNSAQFLAESANTL
jgi:addiction module HigA family antidote